MAIMNEKLNIFLDESGKNNTDISLIGAISIPQIYYNNPKIQKLNARLQSEEFRLHFTQYNKYDYELYREIVAVLTEYSDQIQLNLILFKRTQYKKHRLLGGMSADMIYEKIPERVIYGLFRNNSTLTGVEGTVYIENSDEYSSRNLAKRLKQRLNVHFLYRFDNFKVVSTSLVAKNQQIGVEFTDMLLGICHQIIKGFEIPEDASNLSKTLLSKLLLVEDLMPNLKPILFHASIFELSAQDHLIQRNFAEYIRFYNAQIASLRDQYPHVFMDESFKKLK